MRPTFHPPDLSGAFPKMDFFILGAARCGTTSLYVALRQHPQLFLPTEKEPSFFSEGFQVVSKREDYLALYAPAKPGELLGDASHVYFSNPGSAAMIKSLYPTAKFILTLRPPADRAHSLYHFMRRHGLESSPTFEAALSAEAGRKAHYLETGECPHYIYNFLYRESGLYGAQLRRYLRFFSRHQFHMLSLDELRAYPARSLRNIWQFLGVEEDVPVSLDRLNANNPLSHRRSWFSMRKQSRPAPEMGRQTRESLEAYFRADQKLLYALSGLRLASYSSPRQDL